MKRFLSLLSLAIFSITAYADEGMWLPCMVESVIGDMQAKGFKLSAEDIYSINQASLKDAVVLFGGGCTAELISREGLLITNHHCGYSHIQAHSSVEHDYLKDGFWALNRSEELPCPGLDVKFLEYMENVTDAVLYGYEEGMSEEQRESITKANIERIVAAHTNEKEGKSARVAAIYYGNQYFLYVFRTYTDVRLVGAPASSIGKFGGETDNWMWPRHTGDFSMFRIYAAPDNSPADYSPDNVPYTPKKYFKVSTAGVKEGDFTFIYGCPGTTYEYVTSEDVAFRARRMDPTAVDLRTIRLQTMKKYMNQSQDIRIRYSNRYVSTANAWKKWQGSCLGIERMRTIDRKLAYEDAFRSWAEGGRYEGVLDTLLELQRRRNDCSYVWSVYRESLSAIEWPAFVAGGKADSTAFFKNYHRPVDEEMFVAMVEQYGLLLPEGSRPAYYDEKLAEYGSIEAWRDAVFADEGLAAEFYTVFKSFHENSYRESEGVAKAAQTLMRTYMQGQIDYEKVHPTGRKFYPDANLTLRIAYGKVSGYSPRDGIWYNPVSTLDGIIEKDNPEIFDYNIPQVLRDIHAARDYGRFASEVNGRQAVPVCFLATNHTSGGNSGSPVINAEGNLVGINFDRTWEGTMSDYVFDPAFCRNISLDIRYALFVVDRVYGMGYLIDEMELVD